MKIVGPGSAHALSVPARGGTQTGSARSLFLHIWRTLFFSGLRRVQRCKNYIPCMFLEEADPVCGAGGLSEGACETVRAWACV
jgi:hypothetical protein